MLGALTLYSNMLCWWPSLSPPTPCLQMHNRHFTARLGVMEPGWACWDGSPPDGVEMGDLVGFTRPRGLKHNTPAATAPGRVWFCFGRVDMTGCGFHIHNRFCQKIWMNYGCFWVGYVIRKVYTKHPHINNIVRIINVLQIVSIIGMLSSCLCVPIRYK